MNDNENLSENFNSEKIENEILNENNEPNNKTAKSNHLPVYISLAAIIIAVASVIIPFFINGNSQEEVTVPIKSKVKPNSLLTAYINTDTLLMKYDYSVKLNEEILTEQSKSKASLAGMYRQFETKYNAFMEKAKLGSFLSQESMEKQQQELVEEQQRLQAIEESMSQKLMEKQMKINAELLDTVVNYLKEYNKDQKYSLILNNAVVLYGNEGMDITAEITANLNERYKKNKK